MVCNVLKKYGAEQGMLVAEGESTSYSVILAIPGVDRIFLHNTGANDTFCAEDIPREALEEASLFHFGYPSLMKSMYEKDGEELVNMMKLAKDFVEKTKVDALAIAVGNAHGAYKLPPKLDFTRIDKIRKTIDVPLVLHGGSGLTDNDFKKAIELGISKVNIFTDINIAAVKAEFRQFTSMDKGIIDLIPAAVEAIKQEVLKKLELFSSVGKAPYAKYDVDKIVQAVIKELAAKQML